MTHQFSLQKFFLLLLLISNIHTNSFAQYKTSGNSINYRWTHFNGQEFSFTLYLNESIDEILFEGKDKLQWQDKHEALYHDPYKDVVIEVAKAIKEISDDNNLSSPSVCLSFIQSIRYKIPSNPKLPSIFLLSKSGCCWEKSCTYSLIMTCLGYKCVLCEIPNHIYVGIEPKYERWTGQTINGTNYFLCDPTSNTKLGEMPSSTPTAIDQVTTVKRNGCSNSRY